jgi:hypothetical protein
MPTDAEVAIESGASSVLAALNAMAFKDGELDLDPAGADPHSANTSTDHGDAAVGSPATAKPSKQVSTAPEKL